MQEARSCLAGGGWKHRLILGAGPPLLTYGAVLLKGTMSGVVGRAWLVRPHYITHSAAAHYAY